METSSHQGNGVRDVLRALAEVRDGCFYNLYVELSHIVRQPPPQIDFRIRRIADCDDVIIFVSVSADRTDGINVCWSIVLETRSESLVVAARIELMGDTDVQEVFSLSHTTSDSKIAAAMIHKYSSELCLERDWIAQANSDGISWGSLFAVHHSRQHLSEVKLTVVKK